MSRLFDALKESQLRNGAGKETWDRLGIGAGGASVSDVDPDIKIEKEPATEVADDDLAAVFPDEDVLQSLEVPPEPVAAPTAVSLDPKTRLIPHAVESVIADHYRRLRTKIIQQQGEHPFRSLLVTSAAPQEGKTVTVLNLALSFAMLPSLKVLVLDGDLRKGTLGSWLGTNNQLPGLSNVLDGSAQLDDVILKSEQIPMHFILRGNTQFPDLEASQLTGFFQRLTDRYDLVLVDSPPVNLVSDVQLLAASCDAVLLVARAFSTQQKALEKAVQELQRFRLIGTVLNAGMAQGYKDVGEYYYSQK